MASSGTTPAPSPSMELAHVLFMDIVSYSTLPIDQQVSIIDDLKQAVSETSTYRAASEQKSLISMHTGDGMALAFFGSPEDPVHCAIDLANGLRSHPQIKLRMGINSGPVYRVPDIKGDPNVAGGGVNFAQRVMDCGDTGHILLSASIADVLRQHGRWAPLIHELGIAEVKHGERVSIFNLYGGPVGNPATPAKLQNQIASPAAQSRPAPNDVAAQPFPQQLPTPATHRSRIVSWGWTVVSFLVVFAAGSSIWWKVSGSSNVSDTTNNSGASASNVAPATPPIVKAVSAPTIEASASSDSVGLGDPISISWQTTNSSGVTLHYGKEQVSLLPNGEYVIHPSTQGTANIQLIAEGQQGQTATASLQVRVTNSVVASLVKSKPVISNAPHSGSTDTGSRSTTMPTIPPTSATTTTPAPPTNTVMIEAPNISGSNVSSADITSDLVAALQGKGYEIVASSAFRPAFVIRPTISISPEQRANAASEGASTISGIFHRKLPGSNLIDVTVNCTATVTMTRSSDGTMTVGRGSPAPSPSQRGVSDYGQAVSQLAPACWQKAIQDAMAQLPSRP